MAGDRSDATFDRALTLDEEQRQARGGRNDGRRGECGRDGRDRPRERSCARVNGARRATRPNERHERGEHGEGHRRSETLIARTRVERERQLEHRQRGPVRELDRGDAANEKRESGKPGQGSLGLGA